MKWQVKILNCNGTQDNNTQSKVYEHAVFWYIKNAQNITEDESYHPIWQHVYKVTFLKGYHLQQYYIHSKCTIATKEVRSEVGTIKI